MNKRGLSDIVVVVLLILLAIAGILLIWFFTRGFIMESFVNKEVPYELAGVSRVDPVSSGSGSGGGNPRGFISSSYDVEVVDLIEYRDFVYSGGSINGYAQKYADLNIKLNGLTGADLKSFKIILEDVTGKQLPFNNDASDFDVLENRNFRVNYDILKSMSFIKKIFVFPIYQLADGSEKTGQYPVELERGKEGFDNFNNDWCGGF